MRDEWEVEPGKWRCRRKCEGKRGRGEGKGGRVRCAIDLEVVRSAVERDAWGKSGHKRKEGNDKRG